MGPEHSWQGGWWVFPRAMPLVTVIVVVVLHTSIAHDSHRPNRSAPEGR
jgi:uncharacterized membrane protein